MNPFGSSAPLAASTTSWCCKWSLFLTLGQKMLEKVKHQNEGVQYLRRVVDGHMSTPLLMVGDCGVGRLFSVLQAAQEMVSGDERQVRQIQNGVHPDVQVVCPEEGKDVKVEFVRELVESAKFKPSRAPLKFLILDGADRMTAASANALLKTLEEAPPQVRFFALAEDESRVLPTIRSRCAQVVYKRLPESFIVESLRDVTSDSTKALVYARLAEGSVGRAVRYTASGKLSLRDRILQLFSAGLKADLSAIFTTVDNLESDLDLGIRFLEHIVYDLVMLPYDPTRLTNQDVADVLRELRVSLGGERIEALREGLRTLRRRSRQGNINLNFHVKALLASTFS